MRTLSILRGLVACFVSVSLPTLAQQRGAGSALTGVHNTAAMTSPAESAGEYTLHEGDTVDVVFRYTPEFNDEAVVGPDGRVVLKSTGPIQAAGLTLNALQQNIEHGSTSKLVNPDVAVLLKDFDRPHVTIAGEVNTPGRQDLRKPTTAMQAIMAAGGPKEIAAMGRVVLFRRINADTSEVHVLKLSHYDRTTMAKNDMVLQPDDAILVGHDHLESIGRFVKTMNLGVYLQPLNGYSIVR
ncbi:polysaccharide biosynthesis/export family protein [Granulicella cerasi]|uniref:Polysaccharide biosynthesis/export family protein n=1 Tax=Granulicella cerasi TaxID=741063 RepID=A0ABW1Z8G2_9BACT|nr:polysaccharide biosynthesis/export family protein [Granulicella cerasi]